MRKTPEPKALRAEAFALVLLLLAPAQAEQAHSFCGCQTGGVPRVLSFALKGNDLDQLKGECAPAKGLVELQVQQQHFKSLSPQPPSCSSNAENGPIISCFI